MRLFAIAGLALTGNLAQVPLAAAQETTFEYKMISSPPNMPKVKIGDAGTKQLFVSLHRATPVEGLQSATGLTAPEIQQRIEALEKEGLIRRDGNAGYRPTFPIVTLAEGRSALAADPKVVATTADAIERRLPEIQQLTGQLEGFRHLRFQDVSLLILSDVLLDAFQIGAMEQAFLKKERPLRGGGNYYFALLEKPVGEFEPLGIYGNQVVGLGDQITGGIYGNRRYEGPMTLARLTAVELQHDFGFPADADVQVAKIELANDLVRRWRDPKAMIEVHHEAGLKKLKLLDQAGRPLIPVLTGNDVKRLEELTRSFLPSCLRSSRAIDQPWNASTTLHPMMRKV